MDQVGAIKKIEKYEAKRKTDKIAKFLTSGDEEITCAAIAALGRIGDEISINSVTALIDSPDLAIRKAAIRAVGAIGTEYSKTLLQHRLTTEQDADVKALILDMVRQINDK